MEEKERMTLKSFLDRMKGGWGFRRSHQVEVIGQALEKVIPPEDWKTEVEVTFECCSSGYGPTFRYHYTWRVDGYKIKEKMTIETPSDMIFGKVKKYIQNTEKGFICGYNW